MKSPVIFNLPNLSKFQYFTFSLIFSSFFYGQSCMMVFYLQLVKSQSLEREVELVDQELITILNIQQMLPNNCPATGQHCLECWPLRTATGQHCLECWPPVRTTTGQHCLEWWPLRTATGQHCLECWPSVRNTTGQHWPTVTTQHYLEGWLVRFL